MNELDEQFYARADAHIKLANEQLTSDTSPGKTSASIMYATARFNAWLSATGWNSAEEMKASKEETIEYYVAEYKKMLEENMDEYISNFSDYMQTKD